MTTMTKKKLTMAISKETKVDPSEVHAVVQVLLDKMTESLAQGDRIEFRNFGIFETVLRKSKIGRNPKRPQIAIVVPERRAVRFTLGKRLRERVNRHFAKQNG